jgi:hypothetical protein
MNGLIRMENMTEKGVVGGSYARRVTVNMIIKII